MRGVYLDDFTSGDVVRDNIFYKVRDPVYMNGGSGNLITGNTFVDVAGESVASRDAGGQWAPELDDLKRNGQAAVRNAKIYISRYPGFSPLSAERPKAPQNAIMGNVKHNHLTSPERPDLSELKFFDQSAVKEYLISLFGAIG